MGAYMKTVGVNLHTKMKVLSKLIFINESTDSIKFQYVKEHKSTNSTRGIINGEVPKELKDREYK
jgi:hypothetical protein